MTALSVVCFVLSCVCVLLHALLQIYECHIRLYFTYSWEISQHILLVVQCHIFLDAKESGAFFSYSLNVIYKLTSVLLNLVWKLFLCMYVFMHIMMPLVNQTM